MITPWIAYAIATGLLITGAALALERIALATRRWTRGIWIAAMLITVAWPVLAFAFAEPAAPESLVSIGPAVPVGAIDIAGAVSSSAPVPLDAVMVVVWAVLSLALAGRLAYAMHTVRARVRRWPSATLNGVAIRESADVGPAVIGFAPMHLVVPAWARSLDESLLDLVLRHEEEHRSARDPYLLLAAAVLVALVPWNIGLLWQARRLRFAVEVDCDARVLRARPDRERYGQLLIAIAQRRSLAPSLLTTAMSEPASNLARRISAMQIASKKISRSHLAVVAALAAGVIALACSVDAPTKPAAQAEPERAISSARLVADSSSAVADTELVVKRTALSLSVTPEKMNYKSMSATFDSVVTFYEEALKKQGSKSATSDSVRMLLKGLNAVVKGEFIVSSDSGRSPVVERGIVGSTTSIVASPVQGEQMATLTQGTMSPLYPPTLKSAGVQGTVTAQFVVNADGTADLSTFRVLKSTHDLFTEAVRTALADARFTPASVGGRAVRQLMQLPFEFSMK